MAGSIYDIEVPGKIAWAEFKLRAGEGLSGEDLALVLENNSDQALPPKLHEHLIQHLRGEIKPKRGRRRLDHDANDLLFAGAIYRIHHRELTEAETASRAKGGPKRRVSSVALSPSEEALQRAKAGSIRLRNLSDEAARNLLSAAGQLPRRAKKFGRKKGPS